LSRPYFASFDGPKATGKTTILESLAMALRADRRSPVVQLCEKDLDPYRCDTLALIQESVSCPSEQLEKLVCERLAAGRAWITENVLTGVDPSSVVLIDRWYPSDAAFRRIIPFNQILAMNLQRGVWAPDLHVGVITAPKISWDRARARARGLSSSVIRNFAEHVACTAAFNSAIADNQWFACPNESSVKNATALILKAIYGHIGYPGAL
jgi:thymidylate kinase